MQSRVHCRRCALDAALRHFVDDRPERAHLLHGVDEILKFQRLDDIGIDAELVAADQILLLARGGHHHDGNHLERRVALDLTQHLEPVDLGELQVEEEQGGLIVRAVRERATPIEVVERLRPVPHVHDLVRELVPLEGIENQFRVSSAVLDEENAFQGIHAVASSAPG